MRHNLLIAIVSVFLFGAGTFAQEAKKDGWWIKANPQKQESPMMIFYVGSSSHSYGFWRVWNPGDPAEFDVPEEYRNVPTLYILAQTTSGQKCRFCAMYKAKGVKHFEYDLELGQEAKQSDEDKRCK